MLEGWIEEDTGAEEETEEETAEEDTLASVEEKEDESAVEDRDEDAAAEEEEEEGAVEDATVDDTWALEDCAEEEEDTATTAAVEEETTSTGGVGATEVRGGRTTGNGVYGALYASTEHVGSESGARLRAAKHGTCAAAVHVVAHSTPALGT